MTNREKRAKLSGLSLTQVRKYRVHIYQIPDGEGGSKTVSLPEAKVAELKAVHGDEMVLIA